MLARTIPTVLVFALFLAAPVLAKDADPEEKRPEVKVATSKVAKQELKIFERDFTTVDIDFKLDALMRLKKCVHEDVTKALLKVLFRDPDPYVRAEAAKALGGQVPFAKTIGKKAVHLLRDDKLDPKILTQVIRTIGILEYRKAWEDIADLIAHEKDEVVVACFDVFRDWKDIRGWREMQMFWDMYPADGKWATGSVTVDTGAAGDVDARAAKAKWKAKYGNKAKQRPRPDCVKALKGALLAITGEELKKPAEFREWCSNHKPQIKAAERRRD